jgi:hypothetical protein
MAEIQGKRTKIAVCMPAGDQVATFFAYDLARAMGWMAAHNPNVELSVLVATGSLIPRQREMLARTVLKDGTATHMMWLDTDMRFPKDTFARLLAHEVPMVAAGYTERKPPFRPTTFLDIEDWSNRLWPEPEATGLAPAVATGYGMILTSVEVFKAIPEPWFMVGYDPQTGAYIGEDVYMFLNAKRHGYTLMIDQDLTKEIAHIGTFEFTPEHALKARAAREAQTA